MLNKDTRFNNNTKELIQGNLAKRVFIVIRHLDQYAKGITGQDHSFIIKVNEGEGYKTKKEAKEAFKIFNSDNAYKNNLIRKTPYGNIGTFYDVKFLKGEEMLNEFVKYDYIHTHRFSVNPNK